MRPLSIALTVVIALALAFMLGPRLAAPAPSRPTMAAPAGPLAPDRLSPEVRLGLPDCPPTAIDDLRGPDALECWFTDETFGPWHVTSSLEIQGITILRLVARDRRVADGAARRLVSQADGTAEEVLVYARGLRGAEVTRVRWTERAGFETTEFAVP